VLSIGKLGVGQQRYYTEDFPGVDEYYSEAGQHAGRWLGSGAELLGLHGPVDPDALSQVLEGRHPASGERLSGPRSDPKVPGFDLCFRAPKSVSLLGALGPPDIRGEVLLAHETAVTSAVGFLQRSAIMVRRGHGGQSLLPAAGLVGAGFDHFTSRASDPHLHSHVVVANLSRGNDGVWSALDGRLLYAFAKTAGTLYEAELRYQLSMSPGLRWGPVTNGIADIAGVPKSLVRAFSRRRAQIEAELEQQGASSPRAAQVAALSTRRSKDPSMSVESLRAEWQERAAFLGFDIDAWSGLIHLRRGLPVGLDPDALAERLLGPDGLTANQSSFSRKEVLQAVAGLAPDGALVAHVEALAARIVDDERIVAIETRAGPPSEPRFTTKEFLATEYALVEGAGRRAGNHVGLVDEQLSKSVLSRYPTLSAEQADMVRSLCTSGDGVQVVIGVAGAGKTYGLRAAHEAWTAAGYRVVGGALAARAAQELSDGAHIRSSTLARLLIDLADPVHGGLAPGSILVIDEAAMAGTRDLARLAGYAEAAGGKLVLVGDDHQLPSIAAGGAFTALAERLGAIQLNENRRQVAAWERTALNDLRAGRADVALAAYHARGRRHDHDSEHLRDRLVAEWAAARGMGTEVLMLATRRADVDDLNRRARSVLRAEGRLGPDILDADGRSFAVGDEVLCLRNDSRLGVLNGTRATVVGLNEDNTRLRIHTRDHKGVVVLPAYLEAGWLSHGYATTVHKSQGTTTERTFILADDALYREAGYVALSRGKHRNDLYTAPAIDDSDEETHHGTPARRDQLLSALRRSRAQEPAITRPTLPGRSVAQLQAERSHLSKHPDDPEGHQRLGRKDALIAARITALGAWALEHPLPEHLELLGHPPRQPGRRAAWALAAGQIAAYRERHGVVFDPELVPEQGGQLTTHLEVGRALREATLHLDRSRALERDHDLGLGL
jgi:conjugative relaxase-like TrwC/TraI family protein